MKENCHKSIGFLFLCMLILPQQVFSQNVLLIHDNLQNKDVKVCVGKKIKVVTLDNKVTKGRILEIKDSAIVIGSTQNEINYSTIRYFYHRNPTGRKLAGGIICGVYSLIMTPFAVYGLTYKSPPAQSTPTKTYDNPVPGLARLSSAALIPLYSGVYFCFFHKKKYDLDFRYSLLTVQQAEGK